MAYARTRKRNGTRTCETDPRCHAIRTKNALQRGLTTAALRTGRFGVPKPHDAATAPHVPKREGQKLRLLVMKTAPRHAVEAEFAQAFAVPKLRGSRRQHSQPAVPCSGGEGGPSQPQPRRERACTGHSRPVAEGCRGAVLGPCGRPGTERSARGRAFRGKEPRAGHRRRHHGGLRRGGHGAGSRRAGGQAGRP